MIYLRGQISHSNFAFLFLDIKCIIDIFKSKHGIRRQIYRVWLEKRYVRKVEKDYNFFLLHWVFICRRERFSSGKQKKIARKMEIVQRFFWFISYLTTRWLFGVWFEIKKACDEKKVKATCQISEWF